MNGTVNQNLAPFGRSLMSPLSSAVLRPLQNETTSAFDPAETINANLMSGCNMK
jgi:hypothetical protein